MKAYNFYSDPSHGWLKVLLTDLIKLDIVDQISNYSYQKNGAVFLEEDQDFSIFYDAMKAQNLEFKIRDMTPANNYSRIRNYPFYYGVKK